MMVELSGPKNNITCSIKISGSKSISNRLLILNEVMNLGLSFENLSDSEDTLLLQKALQTLKNGTGGTIDIHHAGSDMRFLTALLSITSGEWVLTGSERMKQRPIGELVTALRQLGADITYLEQENFPPLKVTGKTLKGGKLEIDGSQSSQFVSALLLISSKLENGLELDLKGDVVSRPYIDMTVELLKQFGVKVDFVGRDLKTQLLTPYSYRDNFQLITFNFQPSTFKIESDWSSASYWFSICALSPGSRIELNFLNKKSLQADSVLPQLYEKLGVKTTFKETGIELLNSPQETKEFTYDFTSCPDIAQTIALTCFGLGINATLTGLKTLKIKETDRILALKTELEKLGASVQVTGTSLSLQNHKNGTRNTKRSIINTYNDHRMAMSFASLSCIYDSLHIEDSKVVSKSYPRFWDDLKTAGFSVNLRA